MFTLNYEKGAVFLCFEELLPKFSEPEKIRFLYNTSLFLGFYYIVSGKFLGCMYNSWGEVVKKFIYFNS